MARPDFKSVDDYVAAQPVPALPDSLYPAPVAPEEPLVYEDLFPIGSAPEEMCTRHSE